MKVNSAKRPTKNSEKGPHGAAKRERGPRQQHRIPAKKKRKLAGSQGKMGSFDKDGKSMRIKKKAPWKELPVGVKLSKRSNPRLAGETAQ